MQLPDSDSQITITKFSDIHSQLIESVLRNIFIEKHGLCATEVYIVGHDPQFPISQRINVEVPSKKLKDVVMSIRREEKLTRFIEHFVINGIALANYALL